MKNNIKIIVILVFILFVSFIPNAKAQEQVKLYLFWGNGCQHCEAEQKYLEKLQQEFANLEITKYEVWYNKDNSSLLNNIAIATNKPLKGVPVTIIGPTIITGFSPETEKQIKRAIEYYTQNKHDDILQQIKDGTYSKKEIIQDTGFLKQEKELSKKATISLPILGHINLINMDLSMAISILGIVTSFSLPVLWLVIFYACIVSIVEQKKKKLILLATGILILGIGGIISTWVDLSFLNWIARIWILLTCLIFTLVKLKKIKLPNSISNILILTISMAIGILINPNCKSILKTLIDTQNLSIFSTVLANVYYAISYLIPYILLLLICYIPWKKISTKKKTLIQLSIMIATIILITFL